jgi:hypothetical protein
MTFPTLHIVGSCMPIGNLALTWVLQIKTSSKLCDVRVCQEFCVRGIYVIQKAAFFIHLFIFIYIYLTLL